MKDMNIEIKIKSGIAAALTMAALSCQPQKNEITPIVKFEPTATAPVVPVTETSMATVSIKSTLTPEAANVPIAKLGEVVILGLGGQESSFGEKKVSNENLSAILKKIGKNNTVFLKVGEPQGMIVQTETGFDAHLSQVPAAVNDNGSILTLTQELNKSGLLTYKDNKNNQKFLDASASFSGLNSAPEDVFFVQNGDGGPLTIVAKLAGDNYVNGDKNKLNSNPDGQPEVIATPKVEMTPTFSVTMTATAKAPGVEVTSTGVVKTVEATEVVISQESAEIQKRIDNFMKMPEKDFKLWISTRAFDNYYQPGVQSRVKDIRQGPDPVYYDNPMSGPRLGVMEIFPVSINSIYGEDVQVSGILLGVKTILDKDSNKTVDILYLGTTLRSGMRTVIPLLSPYSDSKIAISLYKGDRYIQNLPNYTVGPYSNVRPDLLSKIDKPDITIFTLSWRDSVNCQPNDTNCVVASSHMDKIKDISNDLIGNYTDPSTQDSEGLKKYEDNLAGRLRSSVVTSFDIKDFFEKEITIPFVVGQIIVSEK